MCLVFVKDDEEEEEEEDEDEDEDEDEGEEEEGVDQLFSTFRYLLVDPCSRARA